MRSFTFGFMLVLTLPFFDGCATRTAKAHVLPLNFYIVHDGPKSANRFIDTAELPKLGYIATTPDLVITELEHVYIDPRSESTFTLPNGKIETMEIPNKHHSEIMIQLRPEDVKRFAQLSDKASGHKVLMMLGEKPLTAPMIHSHIETQVLIVTMGEQEGTKVAGELKQLVQEK